jgi:hypothetical protein
VFYLDQTVDPRELVARLRKLADVLKGMDPKQFRQMMVWLMAWGPFRLPHKDRVNVQAVAAGRTWPSGLPVEERLRPLRKKYVSGRAVFVSDYLGHLEGIGQLEPSGSVATESSSIYQG